MSAVVVRPGESGWTVVFNGVTHADGLEESHAEETGRQLAQRWGASFRVVNRGGREIETHRFCLTGAGD